MFAEVEDFTADDAAGQTAANIGASANAAANKAVAALNGVNPSLNPVVSAALGVAGAGVGTQIYNVPLMSAIFNIEKYMYFPLLLTDQGLDIYLWTGPCV
eukprot:COSAG01_NODE_1708_length_9425_cov_5.499893_16_plen_100_part_00